MTDVEAGKGAVGSRQGVPTESTPFNRSMLSLLEKVEYRRCDNGEDIEAVCKLRYKAYRAQGLVADILPEGLVHDSLDDVPNSHLFAIHIDNRLTSTLRLHHISAEEPYGPVMGVFGDVIQPMLEMGETFVQPSQFTADPEVSINALAIPYLTMRLTVAANAYFKSTHCVGVIRDEHAAFYRRIFEARQIGEPRPFPPFTPPVMLFVSDREKSYERILQRFPFLRSSPVEQRMLFRKPENGEQSPLTILPTAKYIHEAA